MQSKQQGNKRNKKQQYKQAFQNTKKSAELQRGLTGFLVTCDRAREEKCVKEIFNILNDWIEKLYPDLDIDGILKESHEQRMKLKQEKKAQNSKQDDQKIHEEQAKLEEEQKQIANQNEQNCNFQEMEDKAINIDQQIRDEINQMKRQRIFFVFETGTAGVVFIKLLEEFKTYIDVNLVGMSIINHVVEHKESNSRYAFRFIPVDLMCKAGKFDEFKVMAEPIIRKYFTPLGENQEVNESNYKTWCLEFKKSNNESIQKAQYLDFFFNLIDGRKNPVDLRHADINIIIEIFKDILILAVIPKYKELKKCNLQQLVRGEQAQDSDGEPKRKVVKISDLLGKRQQTLANDDIQIQKQIKSPNNEVEIQSKNEEIQQVNNEFGLHQESSDSEDEEPRLL
ncbi:UNKNOWN [Stylonychia lemnae]|uniref:Uncharacterized protein n=1 Tax=Stylonychia lemnae TaxID=5949 RepID=A0A077ZUC9_STYLE|nr:UNKNOWN [Stylonychia lemnae]|eukprot:CDW72076.1 UNKNOWN [Stylonychia lemnae]